jgi:hypothetical protein
MRTSGRAPREVYRVYGEREFLDAVGHVGLAPTDRHPALLEDAALAPTPSQMPPRMLPRVAGMAVLVGAVGVVVLLSARSGLLSAGRARRALAGGKPAPGRPLVMGVRNRGVTDAPRSRSGRAWERGRQSSQPGRGLAAHRQQAPARRNMRARRASAHSRPATSASQAPVAGPQQVRVVGPTATVGSAAGQRGAVAPEFGFER